jgi:hypothetical protein
LTDFYAPGISEVAEKIVFDGDGGNSKVPRIDELVPIAEDVWVMRKNPMRSQDHQDLLVEEIG